MSNLSGIDDDNDESASSTRDFLTDLSASIGRPRTAPSIVPPGNTEFLAVSLLLTPAVEVLILSCKKMYLILILHSKSFTILLMSIQ